MIWLSAHRSFEVIFGLSKTCFKSHRGPASMHKILRHCVFDQLMRSYDHAAYFKNIFLDSDNVLLQNIFFFIENEFS